MATTDATSLTRAWTPLRPHPIQSALWYSRERFPVVVAGRGSGKTELARRRVVRFLRIKKPWPDPMYFYALPTFKQAKRVAWRQLKRLIPKSWVKSVSESELMIETVFGSQLHLLGMDKPERAEGVQWDGGVLDECCDQKPETFDRSLVPAFSHRLAWCWRIGAAKRFGVGAKWFKQAYNTGVSGTDPDVKAYTWKSSDILTADQLRFARQNLDALDYAEQYDASWQEIGGTIFHAFDGRYNVTPIAAYHPDLPIVVGSDFNVNPMCWVLGHIIDGVLYIFDELFMRHTNTQAALDELVSRLGGHAAGWHFYGDASGRARDTSASTSDYIQIRNEKRLCGRRVFYPRRNPARADRFAATNALFRNVDGARRCFINPRCTVLIGDLEGRSYAEGTREPDDGPDQGHASDALGYIIFRVFPLWLSGSAGDDDDDSPAVYAG